MFVVLRFVCKRWDKLMICIEFIFIEKKLVLGLSLGVLSWLVKIFKMYLLRVFLDDRFNIGVFFEWILVICLQIWLILLLYIFIVLICWIVFLFVWRKGFLGFDRVKNCCLIWLCVIVCLLVFIIRGQILLRNFCLLVGCFVGLRISVGWNCLLFIMSVFLILG